MLSRSRNFRCNSRCVNFRRVSGLYSFRMASLTDDPVHRTAIFDSLPYYDNDLEQYPTLKEKVEKELAREPKPPQTLHPLVPPPFELFKVWSINCFQLNLIHSRTNTTQSSPLLAAELARVEAHQPLPPLDTVRYQLPAPTSSPGTDEEWREALRNAHAQLEHQRLRFVMPPLESYSLIHSG
jgi:pre-mRNA-splicing factor SPF27